MQSEDNFLITSILFAMIVGGTLYATRIPSFTPISAPVAEPETLLDLTREQVLGPTYGGEDRLKRSYVLVEFGDYQCPPCQRLHQQLKTFVAARKDRVALAFRHYPLIRMHPGAFDAALYAEAARDQGQFWPMHDLLYQNAHGLARKGLDAYAQQLHLNKAVLKHSLQTTANARVRADLQDALDWHLGGTPTLILLAPNGLARRVGFEQLESLIP